MDTQSERPGDSRPMRTLGETTQYRNAVTAAVRDEPIQSSPARDQICASENWLSDMHSALDWLEQRLDTILTPVPPDVNKQNCATSTPSGPKSHVVARLDLLNEGYGHLVNRIERLTRRVEL